MDFAAMKRRIDHLLQCRILLLRHTVKIHQLGVGVIDHLTVCRRLGKEHGTSATKGLGI